MPKSKRDAQRELLNWGDVVDAGSFAAAGYRDGRELGIAEPERILVTRDRLICGHFEFTPKGLESCENATREEWDEMGAVLQRLDSSMQWMIGDWLAFGERAYGITYQQVADRLGYEIKTLYDYVYVATHVEFSVRTEKLSFGHHKLVANLPEDEQKGWLEEAEEHQWSVAALRSRIANHQKPTPLSRGVVRRVAKISAQSRDNLSKLAPKIERAGELEKTQISQIADEQIALWQALKRAVSR